MVPHKIAKRLHHKSAKEFDIVPGNMNSKKREKSHLGINLDLFRVSSPSIS